MCVPTLAISYSRKTLGIMKMVGQERWVCDISALTEDELIEKVDELWSQREEVREDLKSRMIEVKEKARENIVLVERLLEDRHAVKVHDTPSESLFSP